LVEYRLNIDEVCKRIQKALAEYKHELIFDHLQVMINPLFFGNSPIGFFDGAETNEKGGIGVEIKMSSGHNFKAHLSTGPGTNIRVELIVLWGVLFLSKSLGLQSLFIAEDSKVVIDWFNDKSALNVLMLQPWKNKVKELGASFTQIQAFHIQRIFNKHADTLSKEGLHNNFGVFFVEEFVQDERINNSYFSLFLGIEPKFLFC